MEVDTVEGETLYSLTWWKDERQFYQYTSSKARPTVVFTVPGISVNVSNNDNAIIIIIS